MARILRSLTALFAFDAGGDKRPSLCFHIDDMQGHRLLAVQGASPVIDVPLVAGTYQITAQLGTVERSYSVALAQGASFDLYLSLAPASGS